jgi:hypothetical protein
MPKPFKILIIIINKHGMSITIVSKYKNNNKWKNDC